MKRTFLLPLLVLAVVFGSTPAFATREFYALSRSIRALGMGGAFYTLSDDEYALFYNPAGLSLVRDNRFNVLALNADAAPKVFSAISTLTAGGSGVASIATALAPYQGQTLHGGASVNLLSFYKKHFAFTLLVPDAKMNFSFLGRDLSTQVDVTAIADAGILVGYGRSFLDDKLHIGATLKGLVRGGGRRIFTLADIAAREAFTLDPVKLGGVAAGIDFDIGAIYELPIKPIGPLLATRLSLTINNILAPTFNMIHLTGSGAVPGTTRMLTLGAGAVLKGVGPIDHFNVLLDFAEYSMGGETNPDLGARTGSFWKHVNFGVEAPIKGIFIPRIGFHQGAFTAGFGLDLRVMRLDFATYAEELASGVNRFSNRRIAMRLQLGWGSAPPAVSAKPAKKDELLPIAAPAAGGPPNVAVPQLVEDKAAPKAEAPTTSPAPAPTGGTAP